ncbi:hypothetical protein RI367_004337 [Sorochytrium milnesiophthora]
MLATLPLDINGDDCSATLSPFPCAWLRPGILFEGSQSPPSAASATEQQGQPHAEQQRQWSSSAPQRHTSASAPPQQLKENWNLKATIHQIDYNACKLYGMMEAVNLQDEAQDQCMVRTFFEGEIIDFSTFQFWTRQWRATKTIDVKHWSQFEPFERIERLRLQKYSDDILNVLNEYVFMRWKELFFVDPCTQAVQPEEMYALSRSHLQRLPQQRPERRQRRYQQRILDFWPSSRLPLHSDLPPGGSSSSAQEQRRQNLFYGYDEEMDMPNPPNARPRPPAAAARSSAYPMSPMTLAANVASLIAASVRDRDISPSPPGNNGSNLAAGGFEPHGGPRMSPLTIQGFYYIVLRKSDGFIEGFYYDPNSTPFQKIQLRPQAQDHGYAFPSYAFA